MNVPHMTHPDVPAEQAHVDLAYRRLGAMRASAAAMLHDAFSERGGTFQAVTERDIRVRTSLSRLEQLDIGHDSLVFGRIDGAHEPGAGAAGDDERESYHVGRLAVSGEDLEPLVVDWRAPVAEPFYRATGAHPMGLARRRHFLTEGQRVLDLEDELFDAEGSDTGAGLGLAGPQVLRAALERHRTGRMRDIVATIQREQDEVIRAPLAGILVVQGGPGTGKTAVALHRAAYLLYTHRFPLEGQGVLVVGPNPTFLRYIEHVLPSLDENGVELTTVSGLHSGAHPSAQEPDELARLKGDPRMARVVAKAVADRERPLRRTVEIPYGARILRITPQLSAQIVNATRRRPGTHNARRRSLETVLWRALLAQATGAGRPEEPAGPVEPLSAAELGRILRREPAMVESLQRMWPILTPEQLLRDLFGAAPLIDLAAGGILDPEERRMLWRRRGAPGEEVAWTDGDVPLLDEAFMLLGPPRRRSSADADEAVRTFGHVVVDETQDLTPMQLRMLARRSLSGSMTLVGDIAQATGTWAPSSWAQVVEHLPSRRGWRLAELTVNYRTPSEVMQVAARVLEQVAPGVRPPESVRASGVAPRFIGAGPSDGALPGDVLPRLAAQATAEVLAELDRRGTVAVIVAPSLLDPVGATLAREGFEVGRVDDGALDRPVSLLTTTDAKGLEFDAVVVVEPARIARESAQGLRAVYVACTRATQRLAIVHAEALPTAIGAGAQSSA